MNRGIKCLLVLLTVISLILSGCEEKIIYKKNLTLIETEKGNRNFIIVTFEDNKGKKYKYTIHKTYTDILEKGEKYDIGYDKKSLFRPDNEIIRLKPVNKYFKK